MRFLVTTETRDSYYSLPMEKQAQLFVATDAFIRKYLRSGKCKEVFYTSGFKRSVSIWEIESSAESTQHLLENPMRLYQDVKSEPLVEHDVLAKVLAARFKKPSRK